MPMDMETVRRRLGGRALHYFETLGSTMKEATRLGHENAPGGTAVVAGEQTEGRGRHGRVWHSEKDSGLYVSIVLRLQLPQHAVPVLSLAMGLAGAEAIARSTALVCDLRWPNDLMLDERKAGGVLIEMHEDFAVAGIGINVNQTVFPDEIASQATSLWLVSGRPQSREDLLECLLPAVDGFSRMLAEGGKHTIIDLFSRSSSYARRKRVRVENTGDEGVTAGLDSSGFLILEKEDGSQSLVLAGGVRPV
jgi:BirA family transcriptional regulator, biotin operon repressor / biotin---[acetyl-CoA-carboxylase] ligase